jgi:hypothetical protein
MTIWDWLSKLKSSDLVVIFILLLAVLILVGIFCYIIFKIFLKGKTITSIGDIKFSTEILDVLETRDYKHCLVQAFDNVKSDFRLRIKKNNWSEIKNFSQYCEDAVISFLSMCDEYMANYYYSSARIEYTDLRQWNLMKGPEIKLEYMSLFERLLILLNEGKEKINYKRKQLDEIQYKKDCDTGLRRCPIAIEIIQLTTEIILESKYVMTEQCMTEVERTIGLIIQLYYNHYLEKLKLIK